MSENKSIIYLVVIVGLIISSVAGYFYSNSQLNPQINELETTVNDQTNQIDQLTNEIEQALTNIQEKNTIIDTLSETITQNENEYNSLDELYRDTLDRLNESELTASKFKSLAFNFYKTHPIKIGLVSPSEIDEPVVRAIADLAEQDIHQYCRQNDLPYRFEFVVSNNQGLESLAISNTITYDTIGVDYIVGHWYESSVSSSLQYVNDNDMIMISPSSSSTDLAISDDNLFRLTVNDTRQLDIVIQCMKEMGKEYVFILAENVDWAKELVYDYRPRIEASGLSVNATTWYSSDPNKRTSSLLSFSKLVESRYYSFDGGDKLCVFIVGFDVIEQALGYDYLRLVTWYGTDVFSWLSGYSGELSNNFDSVKLISPMPAYNSSKSTDFSNRVYDVCDYYPSIYGASSYDACWIFARAIIETGSTNFTEIKNTIPVVSEDYIGVSGDCSLNVMGDKFDSDYRIMGFAWKNMDESKYVDYGYFNSTTGEILWLKDPGLPVSEN